MTLDEIKTRQLTNQYLIVPSDKMTVVRDLCGIQAQFMSNAMHALKIRCTDYDDANVGDNLVKNWTIRGTVHIFAKDDLPLFVHCNNGRDYRCNEWHRASFWNQRDIWALMPERQKLFSEIILASLSEKTQTRDELKSVCRANGMTEPEENSMFDSWGGGIRELCERGFIHYAVQEEKVYCLSPMFDPIPENEAMLEIARRYFSNMGPVTIHDAMYYFRTTASQVKQWLAELSVQSAECGGKTYFYIENGKQYNHNMPKCLFLAGFDQLMLGYEKKESLYLRPEHMRAIFKLSGIVMPAILMDGQVVGKWKKKNRRLSIELFDTVDREVIKESAEAVWDDIAAIDFGE